MFLELVETQQFTRDKWALEQKAAGTNAANFKLRDNPVGSVDIDQSWS